MHHHIFYYNDHGSKGISLVHSKHGSLFPGRYYMHIWLDASSYGTVDSGGNCSDKYKGQPDCQDPALPEIWPETRIRFKDSPADGGLGQHYQGAE